jgi:hypothetical protein
LAICLEVLGDLHPDTASSFSNIGAAYGNMNKFDKALDFHEKSLNIRLQVLGDSHPETAQSYNNIAAVCFVDYFLFLILEPPYRLCTGVSQHGSV